MRYTLGPWEIQSDGYSILAPDDFYGKHCRVIAKITDDRPAREQKGNAHLIAAAPELYEHGKQILRQLAFLNNSPVKEKDYMNLSKAIAKAEGKE